jgi:hypothetical protein
LPFTVAHPAAILPLRKRLIFSALVMGAIAPDLHYYVGLGSNARPSHSFAGAFIICLPSALATLWLFHRVLKLPLISLAPEWHQQRLARFASRFRFGPPKRFCFILISLLAGIFSHLFWDSFTHGYGFMVRHVALLRIMPFEAYGSFRPVYNLLQHLSTVVGTAVLGIAYYRWSIHAAVDPVPAALQLSPRLKGLVTAAIGSSASVLALAYAYADHSNRFSSFVVNGAISFTSLAVLGLLGFSLFWHRGMGSAPSTSQT